MSSHLTVPTLVADKAARCSAVAGCRGRGATTTLHACGSGAFVTLGIALELSAQRTNLTWPRPCLLR
eukprot:COSAG01_NODE_9899_length_2307_cov_1871.317935_1_plen_66_part_10